MPHRKKPAADVLAANLRGLMASDKELKSGPKIAQKSGISQKTVSNMSAGRYSTTIGSVEAVAKAFGLEAYQLLMPGADSNALAILIAYNETDERGRELLLSAAEAVQPVRGNKTGTGDTR